MPLLLVAGIFAITAILFFLIVPRKAELLEQTDSEEEAPITASEFVAFCWEEFGRFEFVVYGLMLCCAEPAFQGLLEWLPTYVYSQGRQDRSAEISLVFNVTAVIGSFCIGKLYE